jgi:putative phosphoribosyl transferase
MTAIFEDRVDAARRFAAAVLRYRGDATIVLGLPRGGVPIARRVADDLNAPLDVLGIRKLGSPRHPEFAVGAIGEDGVRVIDPESLLSMRVSEAELAQVEQVERTELARQMARFRADRPRLDLAGKRAIIVDDGVATGATAAAACRAARQLGAEEIILAVPVAPPDWMETLAGAADSFVAIATPHPFWAVGRWYARFEQVTDDEVMASLDRP